MAGMVPFFGGATKSGCPAFSWDILDATAIVLKLGHDWVNLYLFCYSMSTMYIHATAASAYKYREKPEERNARATALAISSPFPRRFMGTRLRIAPANSSTPSLVMPRFPKIGVAIGPGLTAFTRIPRPTSSAAATRTKERSAALLAA
jgi:hypothetical protein